MARKPKMDTSSPMPEAPPNSDPDSEAGPERATQPDRPADSEINDPEPEVVLDVPEAAHAEAAEPYSTDGPAPPAAPEPKQRNRFLPLVLGGAVAAGLGFGAATLVLPGLMPPDPPQVTPVSAAELQSQSIKIAALTAELTALRDNPATAELAAAQSALAETLAGRIDTAAEAVSERIDAAARQIEAIDARLVALEKRPIAGGAASNTALEAYAREMADLRAEIDANRNATTAAQAQIAAAAQEATIRIKAAEAEASKLRAEAESAGQAATARAALSRVYAAFESGASLEGGLADLANAGVDIPPELTQQAIGVPSLAALRGGFAPAARNALAASRKANASETVWERVGAFLRSQSGARSLSPRAGDDADAVLSRAEAALNTGDLQGSLTELRQLPEPGLIAMAEWMTLAERRIAAKDAIAAIAREVN